MIKKQQLTYLFLLFIVIAGFAAPAAAFSSDIGSITTCGDVRGTSGDGITGGMSGFSGAGGGSFSGGGSSFSFDPSSHNTEAMCAGVSIAGAPVDIEWAAFDIEPDTELSEAEQEEQRISWYGLTTRDANRGRAGKNNPLFMNAHGLCRKIDNTPSQSSLESEFVDVINYETWQTVHGVPPGGDVNSGYTRVANRPDLPPMAVCCSPVEITICGNTLITDYATVGDVVEVYTGGGYARLSCASNNNFVAIDVIGICGGGGGGSEPSSNAGYRNPNNGGTISQNQFDSLPSAVQQDLADQGYAAAPDVDTNAQGARDAAEAAEAAEAEAEAEAEAAAEAAQREKEEAERAAAEAEAAANESDDDDD